MQPRPYKDGGNGPSARGVDGLTWDLKRKEGKARGESAPDHNLGTVRKEEEKHLLHKVLATRQTSQRSEEKKQKRSDGARLSDPLGKQGGKKIRATCTEFQTSLPVSGAVKVFSSLKGGGLQEN